VGASAVNCSGTGSFGNVACSGTGTFSSITCSGTGSFSTINTQNLITAAETDTGNLTVGGTLGVTGGTTLTTLTTSSNATVGGTLAVAGYMGCACTASYYNNGVFVNNATTSVKWGALSSYGPQTITHTTNTGPFRVANAGFYLVVVNLTIDSTGYGGGGPTALNIAYSTNDSSYSNVVVVQQNYQFPGSQNIYATGMLNMAANSYVQVYFYNNSGSTVNFTTTAAYSTIQIARVA
jgi:hypothetical protein